MSDQAMPAVVSPADGAPKMSGDDMEAIKKLRDAFTEIKRQLSRVIVGQDQVIE